MRNKSEEFGVCVDTRKREDGCFHQVTLFSFLSPPQDFSLFGFGKEISFLFCFCQLCCLLLLFDDVILVLFWLEDPPRKKSTHFVVLSVVSRSPGKLFKRTLTYCGKRTNGYVKRERERKEEEAHFLLRLTSGCSKNAG